MFLVIYNVNFKKIVFWGGLDFNFFFRFGFKGFNMLGLKGFNMFVYFIYKNEKLDKDSDCCIWWCL